jgi:surface polysaccharide O-acyltransferase-like enzyme
MIMITMLHIIGHGGILDSSEALSANYEITWFVELLAYCSVNVYALVSGYVGYGRKQKIRNVLMLHSQVWFYTLVTTSVFFFAGSESVNGMTWIKAVLPVAFNIYWYFTAYFCLFFVSPFLNMVIDKFSCAAIRKLLLVLFVIFSLLPTLLSSDFGFTIGGRSALWLMIMYLVGAYIKRYVQINEKLLPKLIIGFFVSILITWASKYIIELVTLKIIGEPKFGNYLVNYTSPLIVAAAVFLLLLFSKMQLGTRAQSILRFFAPLTFGVYLLQEEPLIRSAFITGKLTWVASVNGVAIPFITVGISMLVWLAGSLIDYMRTLVFRFLRVNTLCARLEMVCIKYLSTLQIEIEPTVRE